MKKFTILICLFALTLMTGSAFASVFCMTSDAVVFVDGQEDMFESSSVKNAAVGNGMFELDFDNRTAYTTIADNVNHWIGTKYDSPESNGETFGVVVTMDWNTMTYTKHTMQYTPVDGGHFLNKLIVTLCKGER